MLLHFLKFRPSAVSFFKLLPSVPIDNGFEPSSSRSLNMSKLLYLKMSCNDCAGTLTAIFIFSISSPSSISLQQASTKDLFHQNKVWMKRRRIQPLFKKHPKMKKKFSFPSFPLFSFLLTRKDEFLVKEKGKKQFGRCYKLVAAAGTLTWTLRSSLH